MAVPLFIRILVVSGFVGLIGADTGAVSESAPKVFYVDSQPKEVLDFVSTVARDDSNLKVFWWNLQRGWTNRRLEQQKKIRYLEENLLALIRSTASPDVLMLGEFNEKVLESKVLREIKNKYPYYQYHPYSPTYDKLGIGFFSRYQIEEDRAHPLDWVSPYQTEEEQRAYKEEWWDFFNPAERVFERTYLRFTVKLPNDQSVNLIPVHLLNPWFGVMRRNKGWTGLSWEGKIRSIGEITEGTANPLMNQVENLILQMLQDVSEKPRIMMGDFNVPYSFLAIETYGYKRLHAYMDDAFPNHEATFPSSASGDFIPPVKIDHSFYKDVSVVNSKVLTMKGSDHYPLYVTFRKD